MTNGSASAVNVTATCPVGSTLVGGGTFQRRLASAAEVPNNGLKVNGTIPSAADGTPAASDSTNPRSWTAVAGFGGQAESGDQATAFADCATSGPTATSVRVSPSVSVALENAAPLTTTATCPLGTRLVGGGAVGLPPRSPRFNPIASYPSDVSGSPVANGTANPVAWTAYGSAGAPAADQQITAYAICSTDPSLSLTVARVDAPGPQVGTTFTTTTASCPTGGRALSGGVKVDKTGGVQPQQGVHLRGSFPSDAIGNAVPDSASNPGSWTGVVQAGGQNTPDTQVHVFAMCALAAVTAPGVTTGVASSITQTGASLAGTINPHGAETTYTFEYGTTTSFGSVTSAASAGSGTADVAVTASLSGLAPGTTYFYRVAATNSAGTTVGTTRSFTTAQPAPTATTGSSAVSITSASVAGSVNPNGLSTNYTFEYGTSTSFGAITPVLGAGAGSSTVPVSASLTGLSPNTTYVYRLVAASSAGTSFGAVRSLRTNGTGQAPVVVTQAVTEVTNGSAVLHGQVNPKGDDTAFTFEYGTSTSFGSITTVVQLDNADALEPVTATLTGLNPDTTYYYRVVAANGFGTAMGAVVRFSTGPGGVPNAGTGAASAITATSVTLAGTVDAHGSQTAFAFEYGPTTSFGFLSAVDSAGDSNALQSITLPISGLTPNTTYRYRLVATNANGGTTTGVVRSFTTGTGT
jgi:phosphodiesterase/alkaline phosphatase D-like protein